MLFLITFTYFYHNFFLKIYTQFPLILYSPYQLKARKLTSKTWVTYNNHKILIEILKITCNQKKNSQRLSFLCNSICIVKEKHWSKKLSNVTQDLRTTFLSFRTLVQWFFNFLTILPILDILKNQITPTIYCHISFLINNQY